MPENYYQASTRKGLIAEAVVTLTLLENGVLLTGYRSADKKEQFQDDIDIVGRFDLSDGQGIVDKCLSIKCQEAGAMYGKKGEFGFELYEIRACDGGKDVKPFYTSSPQKLIAIMQAGTVYLFDMGTLRKYLNELSGDPDNFPKVRGLTEKLKQALRDSNYRYSDTVSGYVDVADFCEKASFFKMRHFYVSKDLADAANLLSQVPLSIDALRDTAYTVELLRFTKKLTSKRTKGTQGAMLELLKELTNLYA
jgi:hypothetical protein